MSRRIKKPPDRRRRTRRTFFWILCSAVVIALLYWEQTATLYVVSTLAMCGLLLTVAFSNLELHDEEFRTRNEDGVKPTLGDVSDSVEKKAA